VLRRWRIFAVMMAIFSAWSLLRAQRPFKEYPGREYTDFPVPPDWNRPFEWTRARLRVPGLYHGFRGGDRNWTTDYPRSDRHFAEAMRRLTRVNTRSVEQPVNLDDGEAYDWPFLYGVEVGHWELTDAQAKAMREFLLRGGFFMCDDFHGSDEWQVLTETMRKVFPERAIVDLPDKDQIFHGVFDLDERYQVPGAQFIRSRSVCEKCPTSSLPGVGGDAAHWRGIYDDHGRVMVAICHNMDLGDSWEQADNPQYPEKYSALGMRIGINYVVYSMTH